MKFDLNSDNYHQCTPTRGVVESIAQSLDRTTIEQPGYVYIPDTKSHFSTLRRCSRFQRNLLKRLEEVLDDSQFVTDFMLPGSKDADAIHAQAKRSVVNFEMNGLDQDNQPLHQDSYRFMFSSILYGPRFNVHGGDPLIFDFNRCALETGLTPGDLRYTERAYDFFEESEPGIHDDSMHGWLHKKIPLIYPNYLMQLNVDHAKYPLLIFNNRKHAGIAHGATRTTIVEPHLPAKRKLMYASIAYSIPKKYLKKEN